MSNGELEATGNFHMTWYDDALAWNASQHSGITFLRVTQDEIWTPGVTQINTVGEHFIVSFGFLTYTGKVVWGTSGEFRTFCDLNMHWYPKDEHTCAIVLIALSHTSSQVALEPLENTVGIDNMQAHGQWLITNSSVTKMVFKDRQEQYESDNLVYSIVMQRKPEFALLHKSFPLLLISFASLFAHVVPLLSGERISFAVTLFLSLVFWEALIVEELPQNSSKISLLSIIMTLSLILSTFSVIETVFFCRLAVEQDRPIPKMLERLAMKRKRVKRKLEPESDVAKHDTGHNVNDQEEDITLEKVTRQGNTAKQSSENILNKEVETNNIKITWLDVADILDQGFGVFNLIIVTIMCVVFISIFAHGSS